MSEFGAGVPVSPMTLGDKRPYALEGFEPLRFRRFEGGQFVDDQGVEVPFVVFYEPRHILPVDDVNERSLLQGFAALLFAAENQGIGQPAKVIPFSQLLRPGILRYALGSDDEDFAYVETVQYQVPQGGQRYHAFAETHIEDQTAGRMRQHEIGRKGLVIMRIVFHPKRLQSVLCRLRSRP
jgi:hypothetical protein